MKDFFSNDSFENCWIPASTDSESVCASEEILIR